MLLWLMNIDFAGSDPGAPPPTMISTFIGKVINIGILMNR